MGKVIQLTAKRRRNLMEKKKTGWVMPSKPAQSKALKEALKAVETMHRPVKKPVPFPPTAKMLEAGVKAGRVHEKTAAKVFAAMIIAADKE